MGADQSCQGYERCLGRRRRVDQSCQGYGPDPDARNPDNFCLAISDALWPPDNPDNFGSAADEALAVVLEPEAGTAWSRPRFAAHAGHVAVGRDAYALADFAVARVERRDQVVAHEHGRLEPGGVGQARGRDGPDRLEVGPGEDLQRTGTALRRSQHVLARHVHVGEHPVAPGRLAQVDGGRVAPQEPGPRRTIVADADADPPLRTADKLDAGRDVPHRRRARHLSLIHISEPTRLGMISY